MKITKNRFLMRFAHDFKILLWKIVEIYSFLPIMKYERYFNSEIRLRLFSVLLNNDELLKPRPSPYMVMYIVNKLMTLNKLMP